MLRFLKNNTFLVCYSILLCVINFTPILHHTIPVAISSALWGGFVICFFSNIFSHYDYYLNKVKNYWIIYLLICCIYYLIGVSEGKITDIRSDVIYIIPFFIYLLVKLKCDKSQLHILFHIFCFIIAFNIVDNIRICVMYPIEVTFQSLHEELENFGIYGLNIGGASFLNMSIFFLNIILFVFFRTKNKTEKFLFGVYVIATLFFDVVLSLKASIVLFALLSVIFQYIAFHAKNFKRAILWLTAVFVFSYLIRDFLIYNLVDFIGSDRIATRLLVYMSEGNNSGDDGSFTARTMLWLCSIQTWLKNIASFLFGIGNRVLIEGQSAAVTGIGGHSDFFDTLARYGIVGAFFVFGTFVNLFKYLRRTFVREVNFIVGLFTIVLLFSASKKILWPEIGMILFCLLPICLQLYSNDEQS